MARRLDRVVAFFSCLGPAQPMKSDIPPRLQQRISRQRGATCGTSGRNQNDANDFLAKETRALHSAASACKAAGAFGADEVRQLRLMLKKARTARLCGSKAVEELADKYRVRSTQLLE